MNENWQWVVRYAAVILIAVVLAAVLGSMGLFETTTVGRKLSAANIVRFLGYGGALAVFWLLGRRAVDTLAAQGGRWSFLGTLILPFVTLIVVALAHNVGLLVLRPFFDADLRNLYNWLFIAGIVGSAGWLIVALFNQSNTLTTAVTSAARREEPSWQKTCASCGTQAAPGAKFCAQCGAPIPG